MSRKKRPRGRPSLPDGERRIYIVHVRLNGAEHVRMKRQAADAGRSMSAHARISTLGR